MNNNLYNSAKAYFKKTTTIEKVFYFSLILITLYCIIIPGLKNIENMETSTTPSFISIEGVDIFDNFYANIYDVLFFSKQKNDFEIDLIVKNTSPSTNSDFLDVGSGTGHYVGELYKEGYKIEGIDLSEEMINKSKENYPDCKFTKKDAMTSITFEPKSFTHIMCMYFTIYKFENQKLFFDNCMYWLKPNGYLIFHAVDRDLFDPTIPGNELSFSNNKITSSQLIIKNYRYNSDFELIGNIATFTETFTNVQDNSVRKNTHKLFMPTIESILDKAKSSGFVVENITELLPVGYEYQYIYILKKPA